MLVLGIETSCDETAVALVDDEKRIRAHRVLSQLREHAPFGGVVPEIAARAHLDYLDDLIGQAFAEAGCAPSAIDAVAATAGPGLIGGVFVGVMTAKAMAAALGKPFVAVNHLEAHALTVRLTAEVAFPYLLLLVSGGHCQLLAVEGVGRYAKLGTTLDDAAGETFDKAAKLLGLGFPGGPAIEAAALDGDPHRFALPRPLLGRKGCDFSFSGLKTALRQEIDSLGPGLSRRDVADLAAGLQSAIAAVLADRVANAAALFRARCGEPSCLVVAGGVAANKMLRTTLQQSAENQGFGFLAPPPSLCTDNAAMVAWAGIERFRLGLTDGLDFAARPRWPLEELARAAKPQR
jgi:N6-L-threonylcarbamoyladenine synthase